MTVCSRRTASLPGIIAHLFFPGGHPLAVRESKKQNRGEACPGPMEKVLPGQHTCNASRPCYGVQSMSGVTAAQNSASSWAACSRSGRLTTSTGLCM